MIYICAILYAYKWVLHRGIKGGGVEKFEYNFHVNAHFPTETEI